MIHKASCDSSSLFNLANEAVSEAGDILRHQYGRRKEISHKSRIDLVTDVDIKSEKAVISLIKSRYPDHDIVTEERDMQSQGSPYRWILDPLDGTVNYAHDYPFFCVSLALEVEGELELGVVYNPVMQENFCARRGGGAFLNGEQIVVSGTADLEQGFLATGFPYDIRETNTNINTFSHMIMQAQAIRRDGSAALNLCYTAMGRFDGYWEAGLHPWDAAAGTLICREAGGKVTGRDGGAYLPGDRWIVASNGCLHDQFIEELRRSGETTEA